MTMGSLRMAIASAAIAVAGGGLVFGWGMTLLGAMGIIEIVATQMSAWMADHR